jgi:hypothetical protein
MTQLPHFKRDIAIKLRERLEGKINLIQVLIGPRQVGKTTAVKQALSELSVSSHYASADLPAPPDALWIRDQWEKTVLLARENGEAILALDEIQKVHRWSEEIKRLWDEKQGKKGKIRLVLLGSSSLLIQKGLTESLAGRFELLRCYQWDYQECRQCFGWDLEKYIFFGGYPGAAPLIDDLTRWSNYVNDSLIETAISKDVLLMNPVEKPALLRRLFILACEYGGQIVSYQKMLGQLVNVGNTTTLAHYQRLLESAYLIAGLEKYSGSKIRSRSSSPKWLPLTTTFTTALLRKSLEEIKQDKSFWGRLAECAVGAHLFHGAQKNNLELYYWREGIFEVDYILKKNSQIIAIEVKTGRKRDSLSGLQKFQKKVKGVKTLIVGDAITIEDFLKLPVTDIFRR